MPGEEKEGEAPKVVKKLKKIKKEPALQPGQQGAPEQPDAVQETPPAVPPAPAAEEPAHTAPPVPPDAPRPPSAQAIPAPRPAPETPRPPPPPPKAEDAKSVDGRISSIDIEQITSELEKDILSTLSSEMGILTNPQAQPKERKEVRDDHAAATPLPPRPQPPLPPRPQDRAVENEQRERRVAYRLGKEFDKLPVNMRNELIKTLSRTDDVKVREDVVIACASNFDKLPPEVRGLLRTLANDRDSRVREEVAFELNRNFAKISPEYRSELIPLLVRDIDVKVREDIVAVIASHYDRQPPEIQAFLKTLASDRKPGVRDQVHHEVLRNAEKIPEAVRLELGQLMEKAAAEHRDRE